MIKTVLIEVRSAATEAGVIKEVEPEIQKAKKVTIVSGRTASLYRQARTPAGRRIFSRFFFGKQQPHSPIDSSLSSRARRSNCNC